MNMNRHDEAHIVYASDNNFAEILGVSLISLFENSQEMKEINVYILDSGIGTINKQKIELICSNYKRKAPYWIKAKNISKELSINVAVDRGSLSQYARLFVSSMLPNDLHRVLYLDCDVLILESIKGLWNLDIEGKTIAALMDAFSKNYRININLNPKDIMFNSGVMLIDLIKWRETKIEEKLLSFILSKKGKIQQGDQGALNAVLSNDTYCFDPCFNSVTIFFDFSYNEILTYRKPPKFYSKEQIQIAVSKPTIVHFTTSFLSLRPWMEGCQHRYVNEWLKYKSMSCWANVPLWKDTRKGIKKAGYILAKGMPRKMMCYLCGALQAYVRPIIYYLKSVFC